MKNTMLAKIFATESGFSALALRVPVGITFIAHGAQKLFGAFGGYGLEGTGQWMASIGLEPGYTLAFLTGSAEFFGGIALLLGLLTRPAAAILCFEFALALLAITVSLLFSGAGKLSVDSHLAARLAK